MTQLTRGGSKSNYALIGPRRIGKTAILEELERRLTRDNVIVARIDFSKYAYDPSEFSQALVSSLTESYQKILDSKSRLLTQVKHASVKFDVRTSDMLVLGEAR